MALELPDLVQRVFLETSGVESGAATAESKIGGLASSLGSIGGTMTKSVTLPILGIAAAAIESAETLQKSTNQIQIATGATGDKLEALRGVMIHVADDTGQSFSSVATVVSKLYSTLGLTGTQLQDTTTRIAEMNRMLGAQAPTVQQVTSVMQEFGIKSGDVAGELDKIFAVSQKTGVGMGDLMGLVQRSGPVMAAAFHLTLDQTTELFGQLGELGPAAASKAVMAMTSFARQATKAGEDPQKAFEDLVTRIRGTSDTTEQTSIAFQAFGARGGAIMLNAIKENKVNWDALDGTMKNAGGSIDTTAKNTETFGVFLDKLKNQAITALAPIGEHMLPIIESVLKTVIGLVADFGKFLMGLPEPAQKAVIVVGGIAAALGPALLVAGKLVNAFGSMVEMAQKAAAAAVSVGQKIANVISPVKPVGGFGGAADAGAEEAGAGAAESQAGAQEALAAAMDRTAAATERQAAAQEALNASLGIGAGAAGESAAAAEADAASKDVEAASTEVATGAQEALDVALVANPIGIVIAAIVALGAIFYELYEHVTPVRDVLNAIGSFLKDVFVAAVDFVADHWKIFVDVLLGPLGLIITNWNTVKGVIEPILHAIGEAISFVVDHWQGFLQIFLFATGPIGAAIALIWKNFDTLKSVAETVFGAISAAIGFLADHWKVVVDIILGPLGLLITNFKTVASVATTVFHAVSSAVTTAWNAIFPVLKVIGEVVFALLVLPFALAWKAIEVAWDVGTAVIKGAWSAISGVFNAIAGAVHAVLEAVFNFLWHDVIEPVWHGITAVITTEWAAVRVIWEAIRTYVIGPLQAVFLFLWHNVIEPVWNGIKTVITTVWNFLLNSVWNPMIAFLRGVFTAAFTFLWHDVIEPVWTGIRVAIETAVNYVWHNVLDPVVGFIRGAFLDAWRFVGGELSAIWDAIKSTAQTVWDGIAGAISGAIDTVKGVVAGFLDLLGTVVGYVPGLGGIAGDLHKAASDVRGGGGAPAPSGGGSSLHVETGGWATPTLALAAGGPMSPVLRNGDGSQPFWTQGPTFLVGEGRPQYPEVVLPTDPMYRGRALGLASEWMAKVGLPPLAGAYGIGDWISAGAGAVTGAVGDVVGGIGAAIGAVTDAIRGHVADFLDQHVPDLPVPSGVPLGSYVPAGFNAVRDQIVNLIRGQEAVTPGYATGHGYQLLIDYLTSTGVPFTVTSTTGGGHVADSYHYKGLAADFVGPSLMNIFSAFDKVGSQLAELFYDPAGYSWKDGQRVNWTVGGHTDHVHGAVPETATSLGTAPAAGAGGSAVAIGQQMAAARGWTGTEWTDLYNLWQHESGWNPAARNPSSGAFGIPQALPADKMASAGPDWQTNPATQIRWGLDYIAGRYGDPIGAWAHEQQYNWYGKGGVLPVKIMDVGGVLSPGLNAVFNGTGSPEHLVPMAAGGYAAPYDVPGETGRKNTTAQNYEILRTLGMAPAAPEAGRRQAYLQGLSLDKSLAPEGTSGGLPQNHATVQWLRSEIISGGIGDAISDAMDRLGESSRATPDRVADRIEDWFEDHPQWAGNVHVMPGAFHFPINIEGDADEDKVSRMTEQIEDRLERAVDHMVRSIRAGVRG